MISMKSHTWEQLPMSIKIGIGNQHIDITYWTTKLHKNLSDATHKAPDTCIEARSVVYGDEYGLRTFFTDHMTNDGRTNAIKSMTRSLVNDILIRTIEDAQNPWWNNMEKIVQ